MYVYALLFTSYFAYHNMWHHLLLTVTSVGEILPAASLSYKKRKIEEEKKKERRKEKDDCKIVNEC